MRRLLDALEPTLGTDEERYRLHFFATDKTQAQGSVLLILALILAVFVFELNTLSHAQVLPIVLVRALFFAFSFAVFFVARGLDRPATLDRVALIWTTGFAVQFVILTALRPASRVDDVAISLVVLGCTPSRPRPCGRGRLRPCSCRSVACSCLGMCGVTISLPCGRRRSSSSA